MNRTTKRSRLTNGLAHTRSGRRVRDALLHVLVVLVGAIVGLFVLIAAAAATAVPRSSCSPGSPRSARRWPSDCWS